MNDVMKKAIVFTFCIFSAFIMNAQSLYGRVSAENSECDNRYVYCFSRKDSVYIEKDKTEGKECLKIGQWKYCASNIDESLSHELYFNAKDKKKILLVNKREEVSLGVDVFIMDNGKINFLGSMPIAAYTKENGERMDYNSILPYVSIVNISNRLVFSFETPLVVLYPLGELEEIIDGRNVFYTYSDGVMELNKN